MAARMANTPPVRLSRVRALAAPVKVATGADAVVEPAAVGAGTVKVAMPPMGAATVTVLLGAPELSAGAAEEAELKGPNGAVTGKVMVETGKEEVRVMVEAAGHEVTVGAQLVTVVTVVE